MTFQNIKELYFNYLINCGFRWESSTNVFNYNYNQSERSFLLENIGIFIKVKHEKSDNGYIAMYQLIKNSEYE